MDKEILNSKEAAEYLRISAKTLLKNVKEKKIPAKKIGREYRFKKNILNEMFN